MSKMRLVTAVLSAALAIGLTSAPALADAGSKASCMGIEASSVAPLGSSDEFPGGMREFRQFIRENIPGPPGVVSRTFAKLHEGTHEACDEAVGG